MAGRIGAVHHERVLTQQDFLDFLPRMIYLQDEPIADPVCMPVYFLSKLARDHGVVVAQAGEGSDELFWGYEHWKQILNLIRWNEYPVPRAAKKLGLLALTRSGNRVDRRTNCCGAQARDCRFSGVECTLSPSAPNWRCFHLACEAVSAGRVPGRRYGLSMNGSCRTPGRRPRSSG